MNETILLNKKNMSLLKDRIPLPTYNRSKIKTGILHIGVGGFHRSHQAYYTDMLMNKTDITEWGICGVGLRTEDKRIKDVLEEQDYLYTLIIRHPDGKVETRIIGSIVDFLLRNDDPMPIINKMADEDIKIVSLTITEGGYNLNPATGEFEFNNPDVKHDLENPDDPKLVFGYLTAALKKRREAGIPPFTIQSCDNIQHNGDMTRKMLLAFAKKQDVELAKWIENEVSFPNAMVDRITPVTTSKDIDYLNNEFGLVDKWPVTCEPYTQWVIEDKFSNGRPEWEKVGVQFVQDVTPYEKMKIRLLNAGHSVLGLLGSIHGHETIDGTVSDPLFSKYLRNFMDTEATPILDYVEGISLDDYKDSLIERFGNPNIKDNLARICLESSAKLPKFLISTINENLSNGGSIKYSTLVIAAWCLYSDKGVNQHGVELDIVDEMKDLLHKAAEGTKDNPLSFLKLESIFGDLINKERFTTLYSEMIEAIYKDNDITKEMEKILSAE